MRAISSLVLPAPHLSTVNFSIDDGEIELNLDQIDPRTFRELDGYMRKCLGGD